jgi:putative oxidoreductase
MNLLFNYAFIWTEKVAQHLMWMPPIIARLAIGYVFMMAGWGKLQNLPQVQENFVEWGFPIANFFAPLTAGWEFVGGILLMLGLLTRISAGGLGVVMLVAIAMVQAPEAEGFLELIALEEVTLLVVFLWLAVYGAGKASIDYWLISKYTSIQKV